MAQTANTFILRRNIGELLELGARKIAFLSGTRSILHPYLNMRMYFIVLRKGIFLESAQVSL